MDAIARRLKSEYSGDQMPASIPIVPLDIQTTGKPPSLWLLLDPYSDIAHRIKRSRPDSGARRGATANSRSAALLAPVGS
jgi:hypothetical protein